MSNKRRPQITDPLEAAKVAAFDMPEDETDATSEPEIPVEYETTPAMPLPPIAAPIQKYRMLADTKVFLRGGSSTIVHKDKIVSASDGADLMAALLSSNAQMEPID